MLGALETVLLYFTLDELTNEKPDLSIEEKRRRSKRTPRIAIRKYCDSPFLYLFHSGNDQALLNCCGIDHDTFGRLLRLFGPVYNRWTWDRKNVVRKLKLSKNGFPLGRKKRDLDAVGALGLVLYWYRTKGSFANTADKVFGLTAAPMYLWVRFCRRVLLSVIWKEEAAKVFIPDAAKIEEFAAAISDRYTILKPYKVWGAIDGLTTPLAQSTSYFIQNMNYNGYKGKTFVNSVHLFSPDGKIRNCVINAPGSWHDSTMASYNSYNEMEMVYERQGARVVVDSAFKCEQSKDDPFLIKSSQQPAKNATEEEILVNRAATSVRQLAEHGMRMIQGSFPRVKEPIFLEEFSERRVILHLMVLLYNYKTEHVGINMILNHFMSNTEGFYSYSARADAIVSIPDSADNLFDNYV